MPVPKSEVRLSVPERGLPELLKEPGAVPVGTGSDTLSDVMVPLETVERGGYGAGAVSDAGNGVDAESVESVPDLGLPEFVKPAPSVLVAPDVSPPAPEP